METILHSEVFIAAGICSTYHEVADSCQVAVFKQVLQNIVLITEEIPNFCRLSMYEVKIQNSATAINCK